MKCQPQLMHWKKKTPNGKRKKEIDCQTNVISGQIRNIGSATCRQDQRMKKVAIQIKEQGMEPQPGQYCIGNKMKDLIRIGVIDLWQTR